MLAIKAAAVRPKADLKVGRTGPRFESGDEDFVMCLLLRRQPDSNRR